MREGRRGWREGGGPVFKVCLKWSCILFIKSAHKGQNMYLDKGSSVRCSSHVAAVIADESHVNLQLKVKTRVVSL